MISRLVLRCGLFDLVWFRDCLVDCWLFWYLLTVVWVIVGGMLVLVCCLLLVLRVLLECFSCRFLVVL